MGSYPCTDLDIYVLKFIGRNRFIFARDAVLLTDGLDNSPKFLLASFINIALGNGIQPLSGPGQYVCPVNGIDPAKVDVEYICCFAAPLARERIRDQCYFDVGKRARFGENNLASLSGCIA